MLCLSKTTYHQRELGRMVSLVVVAEAFYEMGPSLLLHYLRPFGAVCYSHIPVEVGGVKGHEDKASKVLFMGFEDYTLAGYRLYNPTTRQFFHNSATFREGLDIMEMSIPRATVQREGPLVLATVDENRQIVSESVPKSVQDFELLRQRRKRGLPVPDQLTSVQLKPTMDDTSGDIPQRSLKRRCYDSDNAHSENDGDKRPHSDSAKSGVNTLTTALMIMMILMVNIEHVSKREMIVQNSRD